MRREIIINLLMVGILSSVSIQGAAETIETRQVEYGISSLKNGDYETALKWLLSAESMHSQHPDLKNALGLAHYQLKNYDRAEHYFLQARDSRRRHEAAYYLGRVAEIRGNSAQAKQWYQKAAEQYEDLEVQSVSDNALFNLTVLDRLSTTRDEQGGQLRQFGFLALETSRVDGIVNPDDSTGNNDNDMSVSMLAAGSTTLSPEDSVIDWKLGGSLYLEKYFDLSIYNVESYSGYTSAGYALGNHKLIAKLGYTHFVLDTNPYLDQIELGLKDSFLINDSTQLVLHGRYIDVTSPESRYDYNAGNLAELGAELRGGQDIKWRAGVAWRNEDRADLETSLSNDAGDSFSGFTSYSRDWVRLRGKLSWNWSKLWRQKVEAGLRFAEYHDPDIFLASSSDTSLTENLRSTTRVNLKAELSRQLTDNLDLNLGFQYLDDDANNDSYDFNSQTISAGMSYLF